MLNSAVCSIQEDHKIMWLKRLRLHENESIVDCDPIKMTITFKEGGLDLKRQRVECYSRVMGYHRPTMNYNVGKRAEFKLRKTFNEEKSLESLNKHFNKKYGHIETNNV